MKVHLGYEIGSGHPIEIPLGHLVVSGQTQLSGKTTTLEAIVQRSGLRAVAFVTKRGEGSFSAAREIPPFYRSPKSGAMWQYVSEILESKLVEKMKFERKWIMRASRGASNLWQVHQNVRNELAKPKLKEWDRGMYEQLDEYFKIVLPELRQVQGDPSHVVAPLLLHDGINVMRLDQFSTQTQMLCVASVLEYVYQNEEGVITIVPEAWEMVPQGRNTPVKASAAMMFRKGAGLKNFVWFDSQDLAGVDKQALKQVSVWILGVQREENEAKRMIQHLEVGGPRPKLADVRTLGLGEFFVSFGKELRKVYVQPAGMSKNAALQIAMGNLSVSDFAAPKRERAAHIRSKTADSEEAGLPEQSAITGRSQGRSQREGGSESRKDGASLYSSTVSETNEEDEVWREKFETEHKEVLRLQGEIDRLNKRVEQLIMTTAHATAGEAPARPRGIEVERTETAVSGAARPSSPNNGRREYSVTETLDNEQLYQAFKARLLQEAPGTLLNLVQNRPELEVRVQRKTITIDDRSIKGMIARLIAEDFFQNPVSAPDARAELLRRGLNNKTPLNRVLPALEDLTEMGFFYRFPGDSFQTAPGMRVKVVED